MKSFALAVICLIGSAPVFAEMGESADAAALVRAMRADAIMLEASKAALSRAASEGFYTAAQWQCFQQLPAAAFTPDLAQLLAHELSRGEIDEALEFYQSPAGMKFVDFIFVNLTAESTVAASFMSQDDMEAARRFASTGVGKKLAHDMLLMNSPESQLIARTIVDDKLSVCGAGYSR